MYERFTDRARKVMQLANQEAQRFNHEYIGTEHILLGLSKESSGVAANILKNMDVDLRKIRLEVERVCVASPYAATLGKMPMTPRAKHVIEFAIEEARSLGHNYVGTEHLLLGLLREIDGIGAQVLKNLGLCVEDVREETLNLLGFPSAESPDVQTHWRWQVQAPVQVGDSYSWRLHPPMPAEACCDPTACSELAEEIPTRTHKFWLRDDFEVEIVLPKDITELETDRLFIFLGAVFGLDVQFQPKPE